jgi:hypothetical protein
VRLPRGVRRAAGSVWVLGSGAFRSARIVPSVCVLTTVITSLCRILSRLALHSHRRVMDGQVQCRRGAPGRPHAAAAINGMDLLTHSLRTLLVANP